MYIKILIAIISLSLSLNVFANTKKELSDTIPFVVYKTRIVYYSVPITSSSPYARDAMGSWSSSGGNLLNANKELLVAGSMAVEQEASRSDVPAEDLQKLIKQVRNVVCNSIGDGDVRVWVSLDASGKFLGMGASTQSGLEVTFHCKEKKA